MDYRRLVLIPGALGASGEPSPLVGLEHELRLVFDTYQASRFSIAALRLPLLLNEAVLAARHNEGAERAHSHELLALVYQAAASVLTKLGEPGLAWLAAERGLASAQEGGDPAVLGSLYRAVAFALISKGHNEPARQLCEAGASALQSYLADDRHDIWSVYGMLFLVASMAAARTGDRTATTTYLGEADAAARHLNFDGNQLWTAFGPTNVKIHRINTAMELGDVQVALDLGPGLDTSALPIERRVRHLLDLARAYNMAGQQDSAMDTVLAAERLAPEQVTHHYLAHQLVWMGSRLARAAPRRAGSVG